MESNAILVLTPEVENQIIGNGIDDGSTTIDRSIVRSVDEQYLIFRSQ